MNIVKLHDQVKFWIDEYGSPRQTDANIDQALWAAAKEIVEEKYDTSRQNHQLDSFERTQRVRDELYTLVYETPSIGGSVISVSGNLVSISDTPDRYKYLLLFEFSYGNSGDPDVDSNWKTCEPISIDKRRDWNLRNPFRKPRNDSMYSRNYYDETVLGWKIYTTLTTIDHARMSYLREPIETFIGIERVPGYTYGSNLMAIALGDITHSGVDYKRGDNFTLLTGIAFTGENIVTGFTGTDLPITLHEEIAKKAALFILERHNLFDKAMTFKQDILAK